MKPLFLFSLPRSGSTLLQRMLASHPAIATAPEPWILLPLAAMGSSRVASYAEYSQAGARMALEDFVGNLPGGRAAYDDALREFVLRLYRDAAGPGAQYFLDKTPRYFLVIEEILSLFPDARVLILLRNPLDVLSSVITSWGGDRLWLHNAFLDLYRGPVALHEAVSRHAGRALVVHYEALVREPEAVCRRTCEHLGIEFEEGMLTYHGEPAMSGRLGDKSENVTRGSVVAGSVDRWRSVLGTPVRRAFARRYLATLGTDVLRTFDVELEHARRELDALPMRWEGTLADAAALAGSFVAPMAALTVIREQWRRRRRGAALPKLD